MDENLIHPIKDIINNRYVIPLYQRNFAWGDQEIQQLVQDIYETFCKNPRDKYFIGSLITIIRHDGTYEVIDGQQRLTVISLMARKFKPELTARFLSYDSRETVNEFLESYYETGEAPKCDVPAANESGAISDFEAALTYIDETVLNPGEDKPFMLKDLSGEDLDRFVSYFMENVMMVKVDMPADTDVANYFEIMNNRGIQLKHHEVVKSLMMARIEGSCEDEKKRLQKTFAEIWDACAEMDSPVQKNFARSKRELLFGNEYDCLQLDNVESLNVGDNLISIEGKNIDEILSGKTSADSEGNADNLDEDNESSIKAIIDFPNFLMHVFRLEYNELYVSRTSGNTAGVPDESEREKESIPLNEKSLLSVYSALENELDPMEFIKYLLRYRFVFDQYIVRTTDDDNGEGEDEVKWILRRATKYIYKGNSRVNFTNNTFNGDIQPFIVKALSMLQVTYRQRRYKSYLNTILSWFRRNLSIEGTSYLDKLNCLILSEFERNSVYEPLRQGLHFSDEGALSMGTGTPHFLFNFIDYLYWCAWKKRLNEYPEVSHVKEFDYRYWNSVEHHLPQSFEKHKGDDPVVINNLGNLFLISKTMNSRLNNEDPIGKANKYDKEGFAPLRRIIYDITNKKKSWGSNEIKTHYDNLVALLVDRRKILGLDTLTYTDPDVIRAMLCLKDISKWDGYFQRGERWNLFSGALEADDSVKKELLAWKVANPDKTWQDFIDGHLDEPDSFGEEEWRRVLVKYPFLIKYCENGNFGWEDDGKYISMIKQVRFGIWAVREMRSFILYRNLFNKYHPKINAYGVYFPIDIAERPGPELHIWLETRTANWGYEVILPPGVHKESSILSNMGWERNKNGCFYNPRMPYLIIDKDYGIEESIRYASDKISDLIKLLQD